MKKTKSQAGQLGAKATHRKRYEMLVELSKLVDKPLQNFLIKWKTKQLEILLKAYKNGNID